MNLDRKTRNVPNAHIASRADILGGSSSVPAQKTSPESSGKKRRPITAHFQICEVHSGP